MPSFSANESRILTWSSDGTARLWDVATGQQVCEPMRHQGGIGGVIFAAERNRILTWSEGGPACLWDVSVIGRIKTSHQRAKLSSRGYWGDYRYNSYD